MGRVLSTNQSMLITLKELIGIKSGLVLTDTQLIELLELTHSEIEKNVRVLGGAEKWWQGDSVELVRVRVENIEANMIYVLHSIGAIQDRYSSMDILRNFIFKESAIDPRANLLDFSGIVGTVAMVLHTTEFCKHLLPLPKIEPEINLLSGRFKESSDYWEFHRRNLMNRGLPVQRQWNGLIPLSNLFDSEAIPINTIPEQYFDQRYIDYLSVNTNQIRNVQWRQFEYLTAEYFRRNGYQVKIGAGRGDGGIDVTAKKDEKIAGPDLILIQCKRNADTNPVDINTVKAFWTTVNEEGATRGLVVTTSKLTSGAKSFCKAHKYRLTAVENEMVQSWLRNIASHNVYHNGEI